MLILFFYKNTNSIKLIVFFLFAIIIFNGVMPSILIIESGNNIYYSDMLNVIKDYSVYDVLLYYSQNIILVISTVIGWMLINKNPKTLKQNIKNSKAVNSNYRIIKNIALLLLLLSIISYYLYSMVYGGFIGLLDNKEAIRSGITRDSSFAFLQKFGAFSVFSTLLFTGLLIEKVYKKRDLVWFVTSFFFSIYYLYSLGGRVTFISFFVTLILGFTFYRNENRVTKGLIIKVILIGFGVILGIYFSTSFFARATVDLSIFNFFIQELSFPFASFLMVSNYPGVFLFKHVLFAPLYFLPSSIWAYKLGFDSASSFNTFLFMGAKKGESGVTGSIPLDLLSFSWIEGGIIGTIVIGILFGLMLAILQKNINIIPNKGVRSFIFSYVAIQFAIMLVNYGDTLHIIQGEFSFILGFAFLIFCIKKGNYQEK
ncbi:O-antigen polymerase [Bacillus anthracis]|uniref:O-antigen polymerase n=1 Tax=Bacillus anthracis TaxID=1392 RepID=UPI003D1FB9C3